MSTRPDREACFQYTCIRMVWAAHASTLQKRTMRDIIRGCLSTRIQYKYTQVKNEAVDSTFERSCDFDIRPSVVYRKTRLYGECGRASDAALYSTLFICLLTINDYPIPAGKPSTHDNCSLFGRRILARFWNYGVLAIL